MKSVTTAGRCACVVIACGLLLAAAGCSDSPPVRRAGPARGVLQVTVSTTGADLPTNGYMVSVDSGAGQAVPVNGAVILSGLSAGRHSVTPVAFAVGCTATNQIAFVSNRDGSCHIYVNNGALVTRLTTSPESDSHPAWSPDGMAIAFAAPPVCRSSDADGCYRWWPYGIFVIRADGTSVPSPVPYDDNSTRSTPRGDARGRNALT